MRILDRYLVRNFLCPFLFCLFLFISMFIIIDCLNQLDDFLSHDTPFNIIAYYYASMIPMVLSYILPAAAMISALYALSAMNRANEIIAIKANGISGYHILLPIFYIGLLTSVGLLAMNETITPKSALLSSSIKQGYIQRKEGGPGRRSIQNVALLSGQNRMIYARELAIDTHSLYDVIILQHYPNLALKSKSTAQRGVFADGNWTFYDVLEYNVDRDGNIINKPVHHDKKISDIHDTPEEFLSQFSNPEFMSYRQLREYIDNTRVTGFKISDRLRLQLHQKIASPFICFILLWVVAPLALRTQRGGAMLSLGLGLIVIFLYYSVSAFITALGKGGLLSPPYAAWMTNLLFFIGGVFLIRKNI